MSDRPVATVHAIAILALALLVATTACAAADARDAAPGPLTYRPPTSAPVLDPFRPPPEPWMSGNRGIEYGTTPGSAVTAIGPGTVTFAGPVAGRLVVVVTHPDGLRSSYVGLAELRVAVHDVVAAGERVGTAADRLHLGVRRGDTYLDPASLWGTLVGGGRAVLIPAEGSGAAGRDHSDAAPPPRAPVAGTARRQAGATAVGEVGQEAGTTPAGGWLGAVTAASPWR